MKGQRGFTLIELAIVLFILTLLLGGLMIPLTQQIALRQEGETRRGLEELRTAVLGYALGHRDADGHPYLPCPDLREPTRLGEGRAGDGVEDRLSDGRCAAGTGNLPWISLGMAGPDAWGNRYTYAVSPTYAHAGQGIAAQSAPAAGLQVCLERACRSRVAAVAVLVSHGRNGLGALNASGRLNQPPTGEDEAENSDADEVFVAHAPVAADRPGGEFDDLVLWLAPDYVLGWLCGAGASC